MLRLMDIQACMLLAFQRLVFLSDLDRFHGTMGATGQLDKVGTISGSVCAGKGGQVV